ncbi:MAG: arsenic efflux protein [Clostridia bacterium]|nr:arsenic efflux protein [Clostridia bacterium]
MNIMFFLETCLHNGLHILEHTLKDTVLIIPFMFLAYLLIGALERGGGRFMIRAIVGAGKIGPLIGGVLGMAPSCGFSAAASNLYGAGILTAGTLISVYLSTSDEMLAVMISNQAPIATILKILLSKALSAVIAGFALDFTIRLFYKLKYPEEYAENDYENDGEISEEDLEACNCGCGDSFCAAEGNLFVSALVRTLRVFAFIFALSFLINVVLEFFDIADALRSLSDIPVVGSLVAGLIGLIPNCAVSVAVTELFLEGIIGAPFMLTALLAGAGSGLLILFRANDNFKENLLVCAEVYGFSVVFGTIFGHILF